MTPKRTAKRKPRTWKGWWLVTYKGPVPLAYEVWGNRKMADAEASTLGPNWRVIPVTVTEDLRGRK